MHKNSFFNKLNLNINIQNNSGITLIALVITIIVLLILAGVSISMLTGQNGILTQAQNAKATTEQSSAREKLELAVAGAMASPEDMTVEKLKSELASYDILTQSTKFPVIVNINDKNFAINISGNIMEYKNITDITGNETSNTVTKDKLDNYLVVPAGFKILNTSDNVTDGIVIEDTSYEATKGSQFVWIPVGEINTTNKGLINIELKRYIFDNDGKIDVELSKSEPKEQVKTTTNSLDFYTEGSENSTTATTPASDIYAFRTKVKNNHGYYIGRYEARTTEQRTISTADAQLTQLTTKPNDYIYTCITQAQAATLSRGMYTETSFCSDLINSYAWDTATLFLQTFGNNTKYSVQNSLTTYSDGGLISQGTNSLTDANKQDKICNVYDMASNAREWSTESYSNSDVPCVFRGGVYSDRNSYSSSRYADLIYGSYIGGSFRPILYL